MLRSKFFILVVISALGGVAYAEHEHKWKRGPDRKETQRCYFDDEAPTGESRHSIGGTQDRACITYVCGNHTKDGTCSDWSDCS